MAGHGLFATIPLMRSCSSLALAMPLIFTLSEPWTSHPPRRRLRRWPDQSNNVFAPASLTANRQTLKIFFLSPKQSRELRLWFLKDCVPPQPLVFPHLDETERAEALKYGFEIANYMLRPIIVLSACKPAVKEPSRLQRI